MSIEQYNFHIKKIFPLDTRGNWFEYEVTHIETGVVVNAGKTHAKSIELLEKRLKQQLKNKFGDPYFVPPRAMKNIRSRSQTYTIRGTPSLWHR